MRNYDKSSQLEGVLTFTPRIEHMCNMNKCKMRNHHVFIPSLLFRNKITEAGFFSFFQTRIFSLLLRGGLNA
jgi:hypothetical protein